MVDDVLDYSFIRLGKFNLSISKFYLEDVLGEVTDLIGQEILQKGLKFLIQRKKAQQFEEEGNSNSGLTIIRNDRKRLKQIILNILSYAIKTSNSDQLKITYEKTNNFKNTITPSNVKIAICCDGWTFDEGKITRMFNFFSRAENFDPKTFNTENGVGFGLAMSHSILKIMSPKLYDDSENLIRIDPSAEGGNTISFHLISFREDFASQKISHDIFCYENVLWDKLNSESSLEMIKPLSMYVLNQPANKFGNIKKKVLVVEDDRVSALVLSNYLKKIQVEFEIAENGAEALKLVKIRAIEKVFFDLILMDCNMPVMDGFQASVEISGLINKKQIPYVPILAVSANVSPADKEKCRLSGMREFISKPISFETIRHVIYKYIL
jgi:CheY-like chemotaxis protein